MFIKNLLISLLFVLGLSSCGEKDDGNGGAGGAPVSDADGTWVTGCTGEDSNYTKESFLIAAGAMTVTVTNYSNAECTGEGTNISVFAGNFTTGAAVTTPAGAKEVTSKVSTMTVTIKEDSTLAFYNGTLMPGAGATPVCGGGFVKNEAKTLDATKCENDALFGTLFKDKFSLYKVDGNKIYQGECGEDGSATDCSTAAKRSTTLETKFYTKV